MKYFIVVTMRTNCADEFVKYSGTNIANAADVYAAEYRYLTKNNDDVRMEWREYDVPDNWDDMDADAQTDYLCNTDYTLFISDQGKNYKAGW